MCRGVDEHFSAIVSRHLNMYRSPSANHSSKLFKRIENHEAQRSPEKPTEAQIHFILDGLELVLWPSALGRRQLSRRGPGLGSWLSTRLVAIRTAPALQLHEETVPDLGRGKLRSIWLTRVYGG